MHRVQFIHWNDAEAKSLATPLRKCGYRVITDLPVHPGFVKGIRANPPDAIVISLDRLPSHGREIATALRFSKTTRQIPLVFVGGAREKVVPIRKLLPDATYATWKTLPGLLKRAIAKPVTAPRVPRSLFDAYAGRTLAQKLGIKPQMMVRLVGGPTGFADSIDGRPEGVEISTRANSRAGLAVWFVKSRAQLRRDLHQIVRQAETGPVWIAWPKKDGGITSDLTQQFVRDGGLRAGLVDYKICSISAAWSGLLFRKRR